jgi:hypothetical protein
MINPLGLKAQLITAGAAFLALSLCTSWALLERAGRLEAKGTIATLAAQGQVLAGAVKDCSTGAAEVKRVADLAVSGMGGLMEKAEKIAQPKWRTVEKIQTIIEKPAPPGAGCNEAWAEIEALHKKAGATP